jgi:hypothetical protein
LCGKKTLSDQTSGPQKKVNPNKEQEILVALSSPLFPDGLIFRPNNLKEVQKYCPGPEKKLEAVKYKIWQKVGEWRPENIDYNYLEEKILIVIVFYF